MALSGKAAPSFPAKAPFRPFSHARKRRNGAFSYLFFLYILPIDKGRKFPV